MVRSAPMPCVMLQFGHGGEAVETQNVMVPNAATAMLQFGHGGEAVETSSLRPQRFFRGRGLQFGHGGEAVETARVSMSSPTLRSVGAGERSRGYQSRPTVGTPTDRRNRPPILH